MAFKRDHHPVKKNYVLAWISERNLSTLLVLYSLSLASVFFFFAFIYLLTGIVVDGCGTPQTNFPICLYFSVVSGLTIGYGDLHPINVLGTTLIFAESVLITIFSALFMGVVIARLIWPRPGIEVSPIVVYEPEYRKFRFRFYSSSYNLPLHDSEYKLFLRGTFNYDGRIVHKNYPIALELKGHSIINPQKPFLINTSPASDTGEELIPTSENFLTPAHLTPHSSLILHIRANFAKLGGQAIYKVEHIQFKNIVCGNMKLVEKLDSRGELLEIEWKNFEVYDPSTQGACSTCQVRENCRIAQRLIGSV